MSKQTYDPKHPVSHIEHEQEKRASIPTTERQGEESAIVDGEPQQSEYDIFRHEFRRGNDPELYKIGTKNYYGLELGADVSTCNLDDFMVFGNNHAQSLAFFRELIYQHINSMLPLEEKLNDSNEMVKQLFTQETAFEELVQAAEGVPRDAFNILVKAITEDYNNKVSVPNIRKAAKNWYNEDKQNPILSYKGAMALLSWIIENVINKRHARAFLLRNDIQYDIINFLYDSRILHIIKQNISSRDKPGMKFNAYSIDYGCYVDLINTAHSPLGLYEEEMEDGSFEFVKVPKEDYRSIRRAVLNMEEFHHAYDTLSNNSLMNSN